MTAAMHGCPVDAHPFAGGGAVLWEHMRLFGRIGIWRVLVVSLAVAEGAAAADTPARVQDSKSSTPKSAVTVLYDGIWTMAGSACQPGGPASTQVRLTQRAQTVAATMVYGDNCVPAGGTLWKGKVDPGFGATARALFAPRMTSGGGASTFDIVSLELYGAAGAPTPGYLMINGQNDVKFNLGPTGHLKTFAYTPGEPVDAAYRGRLPHVIAKRLPADSVAKRYGAANHDGAYQASTSVLLREPKILAALHVFEPNFSASCTNGDATEAIVFKQRELLLFANVGSCGFEAFAYEASSEKAALFTNGRMSGTPDPEMASALVQYADEVWNRTNAPALSSQSVASAGAAQPSAGGAAVKPLQVDGPARLPTIEQGLPMDLPIVDGEREDPTTIDDAIAQQNRDTLQASLQGFLNTQAFSAGPGNTVANHKLYANPKSWLGPSHAISVDQSIAIDLPAGFRAVARDDYELVVTRVGAETEIAIQLSSFPLARVGSMDAAIMLEESLLTGATQARGGGYQHRGRELAVVKSSPCVRVNGVYLLKAGAIPGFVRSTFCLKDKQIFNARLVFNRSVSPTVGRSLVSLTDSASF